MFFSCCDSVLGDSLLVPSGKSRFLNTLIGNTEHFSTKCRGIGPHLAERVKSHAISRVVAGTRVYSRVTKGVPILNGSLFSEVRTLV